MQRLTVIITITLLSFTLIASAQDRPKELPARISEPKELKPAPLPETGETLRDFLFFDYARNLNKLYEHRGKPVVLFFWIPGDENCLAGLREMRIKKEEGVFGDAVIYAVEMSGKTGDVLMLLGKEDFPFAFLEGDYPYLVETYGVTGVPTIFVVDTLSRMVKAFVGYDSTTISKVVDAVKMARNATGN